MRQFIREVPGLLTPQECEELIAWAERLPQNAEHPQPVIRVLEGGMLQVHAAAKIETNLRNYAGALNVAVYAGPVRLQVLHYREDNRIPWHSDYRPHEVNFKVSMSVTLRTGSHAFEYVSSEGVARFVGSPGDAVLFPSWVSHRVIPLEQYSSDRWSLAAWLRGPEYL